MEKNFYISIYVILSFLVIVLFYLSEEDTRIDAMCVVFHN